MKYKKKPVTIDAYQLSSEDPLPEWMECAFADGGIDRVGNKFVVDTLEGAMVANQDDYIVMGVEGELYPCKPSVFEKTYEKAEE